MNSRQTVSFYIFLVMLCFTNCRGDSETNSLASAAINSEQDELLDSRRGDIEIDDDSPFEGYFYPKPSVPFELPDFITLGSERRNLAPKEDETEIKSLERQSFN